MSKGFLAGKTVESALKAGVYEAEAHWENEHVDYGYGPTDKLFVNIGTQQVTTLVGVTFTPNGKYMRYTAAMNGLTPDDLTGDFDLSTLTDRGRVLVEIGFTRKTRVETSNKVSFVDTQTEFPQIMNILPPMQLALRNASDSGVSNDPPF